MLLINQDGTEAFNMDYVRNVFATNQGEIKVATDFSRGGLLGKYQSEEETAAAFNRIMTDISRGMLAVKAPRPEQVRGITPKSRQHFADGSVQKGHGGS